MRKGSQIAQIVFNKLVFYFIGYGVVILSTLIKVPLLTNLFTSEELGVYSIIVSGLSYIEIIFFSWISGTIWRHVYNYNASFENSAVAVLPLFTIMVVVAATLTF